MTPVSVPSPKTKQFLFCTYCWILLHYSIEYVLGQIDNCIQYGEDADVKVRDFDQEEDD